MSRAYQKAVFASATGEKFQSFFRVDVPPQFSSGSREAWQAEQLLSVKLVARKRGLAFVEVEPRIHIVEAP